jgi:hypothetical protein
MSKGQKFVIRAFSQALSICNSELVFMGATEGLTSLYVWLVQRAQRQIVDRGREFTYEIFRERVCNTVDGLNA